MAECNEKKIKTRDAHAQHSDIIKKANKRQENEKEETKAIKFKLQQQKRSN
jgi:hypothetical protein